MKIAVDGFVFERQFHGGVTRIYHEILPRMCAADRSLQVAILTSEPLRQTLPQQAGLSHQPLIPLHMWLRPGRLFWRQQRQLRSVVQGRWMHQNQPDVWHSTFFRIPSRWPGPVVATIYDLIYERYPHFFSSAQADWTRQAMKKSVERADAVICISETTKQDVVQFYGAKPAKLHVIPLAPGDAFLHFDSEEGRFGSRRPYILYVGRRTNHKNFVILLAAYRRWAERGDIDLVVVGESWSESEQRMFKKNDMLDGLRLVSNVDDHELASIYSRALALVYPSLYEGFGLPLLEAMACGCPIVASCIPSNVEVAGDFALYFEPEDVDALIAALDQAIENGRSARRVQEGVQHAKTYSWDKAAQQTLAIYRDIGG